MPKNRGNPLKCFSLIYVGPVTTLRAGLETTEISWECCHWLQWCLILWEKQILWATLDSFNLARFLWKWSTAEAMGNKISTTTWKHLFTDAALVVSYRLAIFNQCTAGWNWCATKVHRCGVEVQSSVESHWINSSGFCSSVSKLSVVTNCLCSSGDN